MRAVRLVRLPALLLAMTSAIQAQSPEPNGARLALRTDTLSSFLVRGRDTTAIGTVIDQLEAREVGGERVLFRVYRSENVLTGMLLDTMVNVFSTLEPRTHSTRSARAIELMRFGAGRATGMIYQSTGDSIVVDALLPAQSYSSASFDLVLRAAPLREGWSTRVPTFVNSFRAVIEMTARVVGTEIIDGEVCWRVEAEFQGMPVGFWVGQRDRRLCKQEIRPQAGLTLLYTKVRAPRSRTGAT